MSILLIVGAILQLAGIIGYLVDLFKGKAKPNRVSWFLWALSPLIGVAASISQGAGWELLPVFMAGFGPLLVFIASFFSKNSYWKLEKFDYICGAISLAALILWALTNMPIIALILSIISDAFASVLTIKKAWTNPETESVYPFIPGILSSLIGIISAGTFAFASIGFQIYLVLCNTVIVYAILFHKKK